jgi:transposase
MGAGGEKMATSSLNEPMECGDAPAEQLEQALVALDQNSTIIAVVELSQSSWLVGGVAPGIERQPRKKLEPSPERLGVPHCWRDEAVGAGRTITRIALAFEAGRDDFGLARWIEARGEKAHVIRWHAWCSGPFSTQPAQEPASAERCSFSILMTVISGYRFKRCMAVDTRRFGRR